MKMKLLCPNGHKLRVDQEHFGKQAACPRCKSQFVIPRPPVKLPAPPKRSISDTSILSVLGDYNPTKSVVTSSLLEKATEGQPPLIVKSICPRCQMRITGAYQICPECRLYLPDMVRHSA